ncbi:MerR family transcriptional regulator [Pseudarthrobacter sp. C4D7]|uniref:MerR family transcriptional regulator n=1 Tax=Pseudarthrobacter sp. C4D7 TaxID=2735268 RepID=UPI001584DC7B|nr:MerR family transcriptional regulator [Pseudarthrobacter sp. C4D7]NUT72662.1 MerR family transcriptional regulator [Pseudarthrobacter sp. C4D7]
MQESAGPDGGDWPIQDVARIAGTTSRTLRHYHRIGLLDPSRVGHNGYRYYDAAALLKLQRILMLRELGLGLPAIAEVLQRQADPVAALSRHLDWLGREQQRLALQAGSVRQTIETLKTGGQLMAEDMFQGFDHTNYKDEVEERWGKEAYAASDSWWRGLASVEQRDWKSLAEALARDWTAAAGAGLSEEGPEALELAARQVAWLKSIPGTPAAQEGGDIRGYVTGLADMYVQDPRFAANYGGEDGARFVRSALHHYAEKYL